MATKRYNAMCPRTYTDRDGKEKTTFFQVGTAFPLKEKDGFTIELWMRVLPTDRLVLFVHEERARAPGETTAPDTIAPDDDLPF